MSSLGAAMTIPLRSSSGGAGMGPEDVLAQQAGRAQQIVCGEESFRQRDRLPFGHCRREDLFRRATNGVRRVLPSAHQKRTVFQDSGWSGVPNEQRLFDGGGEFSNFGI